MNQDQNTDLATDNSADIQAADVGTVGEQMPAPDLSASSEVPPPETTADTRTVIAPTVGRKVWFYPNGAQLSSTPYCISPDEPMDADVVYVWGDRMVNLTVKDHIGQVHAFTSVTMRQPDDDRPVGMFCEWMPFQVGQAKTAR